MLAAVDRFIRESRTWDDFFKKASALPASAPEAFRSFGTDLQDKNGGRE